ncbi:MAG: carboxymuconolactone decarboxylase family protein [Phycisphaerales bacterium]|nr:carboxymuconolactone decarboxylase family protein [Phycisphaerales bacterium]
MPDPHGPPDLRALAAKRRELTPEATAAFQSFQSKVFADGALDARAKQIIAVAIAHVTQCEQCIRTHTKSALRAGATPQQLMEAAWVAAEMRAGGAYAHSNVMLAAIDEAGGQPPGARSAPEAHP